MTTLEQGASILWKCLCYKQVHVYYETAWSVFHYRDSRWGVRDVDDVEHLAEQNKMSLIKTVSGY